MFKAKAVFPTEGLAPMIIKSPGFTPNKIASSSGNPNLSPVLSFSSWLIIFETNSSASSFKVVYAELTSDTSIFIKESWISLIRSPMSKDLLLIMSILLLRSVRIFSVLNWSIIFLA